MSPRRIWGELPEWRLAQLRENPEPNIAWRHNPADGSVFAVPLASVMCTDSTAGVQ